MQKQDQEVRGNKLNNDIMEAKELRINNIVKDNFGNYAVIEEIKRDNENIINQKGEYRLLTRLYSNVTYEDLIENFKPIELTEEILLKCGFRKENNVTPIYTLDSISIYWYSEYYPNGRLYFNSWCIFKEKHKYLHQLQNLYWCLTNEELQIDL